jgi:hypothetical protein
VLFFSCGPNWSFLGKNDLQSCETPHWRFVTCHSDKSISSLKSNAHLYDFQCLWFHGRDNIGNIIFLPSHIPLSCKWYPHFTIVHTCMHLQIKTYVPCITKCNIWLLCHLHGKAKKHIYESIASCIQFQICTIIICHCRSTDETYAIEDTLLNI